MRPEVSVVIPSRDRPVEVGRAVRSVLAQSSADWELLVVDDGSARRVTHDLLGTRDDRVRVLRHPRTRGVSLARNAGIEQACGTWVAFLDDDDVWWPRKLEEQVREATRARAGFSFTGRIRVTADGDYRSHRVPADVGDLTRRLLVSNVVGEPSTVVVRRDVLQQTGGFAPELSIVADWDMWLRLSLRAVAHALPLPTAAIVAHPGSMQLVHARRIAGELEVLHRRHAALIEALGVPFPSAAVRSWMADKQAIARPSTHTRLRRAIATTVPRTRARLAPRRVIARAVAPVTPPDVPGWALAALRA